MIGQLVRTRFESNLLSFSVFLALIGVAAARYLTGGAAPEGPVSARTLMLAAAWLMIFCLVAGAISLLRQNRERSGRLYAHLPVSPRQNRVAYWLHVGLYPCIAAAMLMLFILFGGSEPATDLLPWTLLFLINTLTLTACFSLVTGNIARVIPEALRRNTVLYCIVVAIATVIFGQALAFTTVSIIGRFEGPESLNRFTLTLAAVCAALVALDIHLFGKKDSSVE